MTSFVYIFVLTLLKITTAPDDIYKYYFSLFFREKTTFHVVHRKNQALFSSKDKSKKKIKSRLLQFLFGALRVKGLELRSNSSAKVRKPTS